ncbi:TolC family protein [candidate division KSB1 bacterium]|nr:TolC family protein [candidate division KSB1 bacterium]
MKRYIFFCLTLLCATIGFAEDNILTEYIHEALQQNLALRQQNFSLQKSLAALKEARGMFLPSVELQTRYTRAGGGRMIDFPIGDLVNPMHQALNALLGAPLFPGNLANERIPFLREEEHETKVRLIQPVLQPAIYYNHQLKSRMFNVEQASRDVFARRLVADVRSAYYHFIQAQLVVDLYEATQDLLEESLRVSQSLFENQMATQDVVLRARAELSAMEQELQEAIKNKTLAASYFNFLLNRPLSQPIKIQDLMGINPYQGIDSTAFCESALKRREELKVLYWAIQSAQSGKNISRAAFLPGLSAVVDYGYQGTEYSFTPDDDYWMASAVLQWNLFNGFQDKAKVQQAEMEKQKQQLRLLEAEKQILLEVNDAFNSVKVAEKAIVSASDRKSSAQKVFQIVDKKYRQGMASQIEFLDARITRTSAELNDILTQTDYLLKITELEKAAALFSIPSLEQGDKK